MKKQLLCIICSLLFFPGLTSFAQEMPTFSPDDINIPYKKYVLENGLRLIVHEDHKAPIVAVNVWYHVGSKNEKPGKSGFAHLFEHLMFNGSENFNDDYFQVIESIGGTDVNGTTNNDRTNYFQNVPVAALDRVLWLESDRMGHLLGAIDQAKLDEQRGVVQNEKRQGENQPYGRQFELITKAMFPAGHPYSWTVIGEMEDLNAASLEDVHEWFKTYYGAANAVIAIAGDVNPEEVYKKVQAYFGDIPSGPTIARQDVNIPVRMHDTRQSFQDRVPEARIVQVWNTPEFGNREDIHMDLIAAILSSGKNSRLYKKLIYEDQTASSAQAFEWSKELASNFIIQVNVKPGQSVDAVEATVNKVFAEFLKNRDLRDESDRNGIRIVIELKRGEIAEIILNKLYKLTPMQTTFGIILLAIVDNQPKVLKLRELLGYFIDHRKTVVTRRTRFDLRKAEERAHILEGILKALDRLDEVIATIRASQTPAEARENLMTNFSLSQPQAQAILEMRLQKLTGLERGKVVAEYEELMAKIEQLRAVLASDELVLGVIRDELEEIKEAYGDARRTEIVPEANEITIEDMIADEDMVITVTRSGYIKRSPLSIYRAQNRGGKGRRGMVTKEGDFVEHLYVASAHSYVLVFTEGGRVHWLKVHAIPEMGPASRGKAIVNLLHLDKNEKIATTVAVREFSEERCLMFATEGGTVKKTALDAYSNPRAGGIIAINIEDGDRLLDVRLIDPGMTVLLATAHGQAIHFAESDARPMGRATRGVRGIRLRKGDRVVSMEAIKPEGGEILSLAERAVGKRTPVDQYRLQGRGGKGIINLKMSAKTGEVVGAKQVKPTDGLILITQEGKIIRIAVEGIRVSGRSTQGVKLMDLEDDDRLVAVAKLAEREDEDLDAETQAEPAEESPELVN